jgi:hypothetical protein
MQCRSSSDCSGCVGHDIIQDGSAEDQFLVYSENLLELALLAEPAY